MASSLKRENSSKAFESRDGKKPKLPGAVPSEPPQPPVAVVLNAADGNLDFDVGGDGLVGSSLYEQGFAYCWSGARANVGIRGGKFCFGCKLIAAQPVNMDDTPLDQQHLCRVGFSRGDDDAGNLGGTAHSFGFGGTGKFSNAGKFLDYGESFTVGDTIVCCVDLENKPLASIGFSKNGKWLGLAKKFDAGPSGLGVADSFRGISQWESALFPHVLLKNVVVQLQFSIADGLIPQEGYKTWASCISDGNMVLGPTFQNSGDCEAIMLVGLPASGKTTWAEKWVKEHPEKRYVVLGTNLALDQMKVPGVMRKNNYGERFDRLMDRATGIFNTLMSRASKVSRNFIIDQTNVYKSARKRKLKPFMNFRKIAVVIFPRPEVLKLRADMRFKEMGKEVPAEAVNEMLANYTLPMSKDMPGADEYFDEVWFPELDRVESQRYLDQMKGEMISKKASGYVHEHPSQVIISPSDQISCNPLPRVPHTCPTRPPQNQGIAGNLYTSPFLQPPLGPPIYNSFESSGRYSEQSGSYVGNSYYGHASHPRMAAASNETSSLYSRQLPGAPPPGNLSSNFEYPRENLNMYGNYGRQNQYGMGYSGRRFENHWSMDDHHVDYGVTTCGPDIARTARLPCSDSGYHPSWISRRDSVSTPFPHRSLNATQPPGPSPYALNGRPPTQPAPYGSPYGTPTPGTSR